MREVTVALPIIQNCWVVPDIDCWMNNWIALGVGPFFKFDVEVPEALYRGRREPLAFTAALAQAGSVQIELVQQLSTGPSAYRDVVPAGDFGFHHVCRKFGEYDNILETLKSTGAEVATEFVLSGARYCYVDTRKTHGCMIELADDSSLGNQVNTMIREASIGWDGRDPIRTLAALG